MKKPLILICLALPLLSTPALADGKKSASDNKRFAMGVSGGLRGLGFDATLKLTDKLNLRGTYTSYEFDETYEEDGIDYDGELELSTTGLMLDFYPFSGSFRFSVGYLNNGSELTAFAEASNGFIDINGVSYDISDEWVQSDLEWDSSTPYVGIGFGNPLGKGSNWTLSLDVGVMLTDEPTATLTASENLTLIPGFNENLEAEEASLNEDLGEFDMFPVFQLGLHYAF